MGMLGTSVYTQVCHQLTAKLIARQHTLDRLDHHALGVLALEDLLLGTRLDATRVTGVPIVMLLAFVAGQLHFFRIDDDDIVATIHVRCEGWLVLATQTHGYNRGKTAQHHAFGVDDDPFLVDVCRCCREGVAVNSSLWPDKYSSVNKANNPKIRYLVRKSGTEPLVRILVEGQDSDKVVKASEIINNQINKVLNAR